jgi:hypothetical protein
MFAPRVATSQTRGDAGSTGRFGQRTSRQARNERDGDDEREIVRENLTEPAAPRRLAWDFGKIPLFPPDQASRSQASYPLPGIIQPKLVVGAVNDPLEHEADRVADQVMRMPDPAVSVAPAEVQVSRKCAACEEEERGQLQAKSAGAPAVAPRVVHDVARAPGRPLDPATRGFMEARFGHDFSRVRVHSDEMAAESSRAINALGYTVGRDIVFGRGQYAPETPAGRRLIAHELTHVVQQGASSPSAPVVQRQYDDGGDADAVAEREYGGSGAPKAQTCGRPSWCPAGFCSPYRSAKLAEYYRAKNGGIYLAGIAAFVDSRVVPFWREYLAGGSAPKNITADFSKDFTNSPTTKKTTTFLYDELKKSFTAKPPSVGLGGMASVDVATQIPTAIAALDDPTNPNQMNFNIPKDIPGNLAGGIGKDQIACPAGANPSPFNDERHASGTVALEHKVAGTITATPAINYLVKDTVDLCPGDCGTLLEQIATVPLSQFEATGISGDVPFTVEFPAPTIPAVRISVPAPAAPAPPPAPAPGPALAPAPAKP